MKYLKTLLFALLLLPSLALASGWNDQEYKQIEQNIQRPEAKTFTRKLDLVGKTPLAATTRGLLYCVHEG